MDIVELIRAHPFFAGLQPEQTALLAGCARNEHVHAGQMLAREGERAERFYLLRRGRVALEVHAPERGAITLETLEAGEVLGWSWLFPPHRWQFSARAIDELSLIGFDGTCLRGKCDADPVLGYALMKRFAAVITRRFANTRLQLLDVYGTSDA